MWAHWLSHCSLDQRTLLTSRWVLVERVVSKAAFSAADMNHGAVLADTPCRAVVAEADLAAVQCLTGQVS